MTAGQPWLADGQATPELNAALRARVEQLLGEYGKVRDNLAAVREKLARTEGTARSADGGLQVTVGPRGELRGLQIDPRTYRRLSPSELAAEILRLSAEAADDAARHLEPVLAPFLPPGVSYQQVIAGQADAQSWAPPQDLGDWWSAMGIRPGPR